MSDLPTISGPSILPYDPAASLSPTRLDEAAGRQDPAVKAAKDFESVLIHKLLEQMGETVPDSGLLSSGAMRQTRGMFWMHLAKEVADNGGLGLWREIYEQTVRDAGTGAAETAPTTEQLR